MTDITTSVDINIRRSQLSPIALNLSHFLVDPTYAHVQYFQNSQDQERAKSVSTKVFELMLTHPNHNILKIRNHLLMETLQPLGGYHFPLLISQKAQLPIALAYLNTSALVSESRTFVIYPHIITLETSYDSTPTGSYPKIDNHGYRPALATGNLYIPLLAISATHGPLIITDLHKLGGLPKHLYDFFINENNYFHTWDKETEQALASVLGPDVCNHTLPNLSQRLNGSLRSRLPLDKTGIASLIYMTDTNISQPMDSTIQSADLTKFVISQTAILRDMLMITIMIDSPDMAVKNTANVLECQIIMEQSKAMNELATHLVEWSKKSAETTKTTFGSELVYSLMHAYVFLSHKCCHPISEILCMMLKNKLLHGTNFPWEMTPSEQNPEKSKDFEEAICTVSLEPFTHKIMANGQFNQNHLVEDAKCREILLQGSADGITVTENLYGYPVQQAKPVALYVKQVSLDQQYLAAMKMSHNLEMLRPKGQSPETLEAPSQKWVIQEREQQLADQSQVNKLLDAATERTQNGMNWSSSRSYLSLAMDCMIKAETALDLAKKSSADPVCQEALRVAITRAQKVLDDLRVISLTDKSKIFQYIKENYADNSTQTDSVLVVSQTDEDLLNDQILTEGSETG